jgi:hypothetical protein
VLLCKVVIKISEYKRRLKKLDFLNSPIPNLMKICLSVLEFLHGRDGAILIDVSEGWERAEMIYLIEKQFCVRLRILYTSRYLSEF